MLTLLPALLAIFGRRAFWPFVPYGPDGPEAPDATPAPSHIAPRLGFAVAMLLNVGILVGVLAVVGVPAPITLGAVLVAAVVLRVAGGPFTARFRKTEHRFSDVAGQVDATHGRWRRWGEWIAKHPRRVWIVDHVAPRRDGARPPELLDGADAGQLVPRRRRVGAGPAAALEGVPERRQRPDGHRRPGRREGRRGRAAVKESPASRPCASSRRAPPGTYLQVALEADPYSTEAYDVIPKIRSAARGRAGTACLSAGRRRSNATSRRERARQPGDHPARPARRLPRPHAAAARDRRAVAARWRPSCSRSPRRSA